MTTSSYKVQKTILGGEILLYILADSKTDVWQVRFINRLDNANKYVRKSTKNRDLGLATAFAVNLYRNHQSKIILGLSEERTTIEMCVQEFITDYQTAGSRRKLADMFNNTYWKPFFQNRDISAITADDIRDYFNHRLDNYFTMDKGAGWRASEDTTSYSTLQTDKITMRMVLQLAESKRLIAKCPRFPRFSNDDKRIHRLPSNQSRGRFTGGKKGTYETVRLDFVSIRKNLKREGWKPSVLDPLKPHHPDTNPYVTLGYLKSRSYRKYASKVSNEVYCQRDRRYLRATWWFIGLLIANCGIRPSEAIKLRHSDISLIKIDDKYFTVINVSESNSKTGRKRNMVCRDAHKTYERYLIYKKEIEYRFNKSDIKKSDWLFPSTGRAENYHKHKTTQLYNDLARESFKRLNLHTKDIELNHTTAKIYYSLYSFRAWYITERLRNGINIYNLSLQVGSSVGTIQKYYAFNEMLSFRNEMIRHTNSEYSFGDIDEDMKEFATQWR